MKKKAISLVAATILGIQGMMIPTLAGAEASAVYINKSDFSDCVMGGKSAEGGFIGTNIFMDGSPWLSKGSASRHFETFLRDETRGVNYCNFYSNSVKGDGSWGAGSMYIYQRDTTSNFQQTYGLCQFDFRMNRGDISMMFGSFTDASSSTDFVAGSVGFSNEKITVKSANKTMDFPAIKLGEWYSIRIVINNKFQEYTVALYDATGKKLGEHTVDYVNPKATAVRTWCFSYGKNTDGYNIDVTNVTIDKSTADKNPYTMDLAK